MSQEIQNLREALRTKKRVPTRRWAERVAARVTELERSGKIAFGGPVVAMHGLAFMARTRGWTSSATVDRYLAERAG